MDRHKQRSHATVPVFLQTSVPARHIRIGSFEPCCTLIHSCWQRILLTLCSDATCSLQCAGTANYALSQHARGLEERLRTHEAQMEALRARECGRLRHVALTASAGTPLEVHSNCTCNFEVLLAILKFYMHSAWSHRKLKQCYLPASCTGKPCRSAAVA